MEVNEYCSYIWRKVRWAWCREKFSGKCHIKRTDSRPLSTKIGITKGGWYLTEAGWAEITSGAWKIDLMAQTQACIPCGRQFLESSFDEREDRATTRKRIDYNTSATQNSGEDGTGTLWTRWNSVTIKASANGMDKSFTKIIVGETGILRQYCVIRRRILPMTEGEIMNALSTNDGSYRCSLSHLRRDLELQGREEVGARRADEEAHLGMVDKVLVEKRWSSRQRWKSRFLAITIRRHIVRYRWRKFYDYDAKYNNPESADELSMIFRWASSKRLEIAPLKYSRWWTAADYRGLTTSTEDNLRLYLMRLIRCQDLRISACIHSCGKPWA